MLLCFGVMSVCLNMSIFFICNQNSDPCHLLLFQTSIFSISLFPCRLFRIREGSCNIKRTRIKLTRHFIQNLMVGRNKLLNFISIKMCLLPEIIHLVVQVIMILAIRTKVSSIRNITQFKCNFTESFSFNQLFVNRICALTTASCYIINRLYLVDDDTIHLFWGDLEAILFIACWL